MRGANSIWVYQKEKAFYLSATIIIGTGHQFM